nr:hypothetical protein [Actinoplanes subtropicus]
MIGSDRAKSRAALLSLSAAVNVRPPAVIVMGVPTPGDAPGFGGEVTSALTDGEIPVVAGGVPLESLVLPVEHAARATTVTAPIIDAVAFFMGPVEPGPTRRRSHC